MPAAADSTITGGLCRAVSGPGSGHCRGIQHAGDCGPFRRRPNDGQTGGEETPVGLIQYAVGDLTP